MWRPKRSISPGCNVIGPITVHPQTRTTFAACWNNNDFSLVISTTLALTELVGCKLYCLIWPKVFSNSRSKNKTFKIVKAVVTEHAASVILMKLAQSQDRDFRREHNACWDDSCDQPHSCLEWLSDLGRSLNGSLRHLVFSAELSSVMMWLLWAVFAALLL